MSTATTRRLARLEQAAAGPGTQPMRVAGYRADADQLAADHPGALIITGAPRAPGGLQG
jgi:hypothetical protein